MGSDEGRMDRTLSETTICDRSYDDYLQMIRSFHGHVAPGMLLGGFMVDLAYRTRPPGQFFDAICETRPCLPDAIQLLTPCTIGNGPGSATQDHIMGVDKWIDGDALDPQDVTSGYRHGPLVVDHYSTCGQQRLCSSPADVMAI